MFFTPFRTFPHFAKCRAAPCNATNASRKSNAPAKTTPAKLSWFLQGHSFCYGWLAVLGSPYIFLRSLLLYNAGSFILCGLQRSFGQCSSLRSELSLTLPSAVRPYVMPRTPAAKAMPRQKPRQQSCHGFCRGIAFAKAGLLCQVRHTFFCGVSCLTTL